jgi:hypothetical protein
MLYLKHTLNGWNEKRIIMFEDLSGNGKPPRKLHVEEIAKPDEFLLCAYYVEGPVQDQIEFKQMLASYYDIPPENQITINKEN